MKLDEAIQETNLDSHPSLTPDDTQDVRVILFGLTRFKDDATVEQAQQAVDALSALRSRWSNHPNQLAEFIARHNLSIE